MARTTARRRLQDPPFSGHIDQFFHPRTYQAPVIEAIVKHGYKRAMTVWHRGAGKDFTWLLIIFAMMQKRPGQYFHVFPTFAQGKDAIWRGYITLEGKTVHFLDIFPGAILEGKPLDTELHVRFKPFAGHAVGSTYQILGAEDPDRLRGTAPAGIVFSEFPHMPERIWGEVVDPRLSITGGWAGFAFTPYGKNHAWKLWQAARQMPETWYTDMTTVDQTRKDAANEDGSRLITPEAIQQKRMEGRAEEEIQQEYYCSFEGYLRGTIYGDLLQRARQEGRIGQIPYDPRYAVGVMLDIGRTDLTAAFFYQVQGSAIRFIDYWAARGQTSTSTIRFLKEQRDYHYARLMLPHDAKEQRYGAERSVEAEFRSWFPRSDVRIAAREGHQIGINAVRRMFSRFYFDEAKCGTDLDPDIPSGLESIGQFRRKWDDDKKDFAMEPYHDKHSHGADALKTGMLAWEEGLQMADMIVPELKVETAFTLTMPNLMGMR